MLVDILWPDGSHAADPSVPISRIRRFIPVPEKSTTGDGYMTVLERREVDWTDFIDRAKVVDVDQTAELDDLLGLWRGRPEDLYPYLPQRDLAELKRARERLIMVLATPGFKLESLTNLARFRELYEDECGHLHLDEQPRKQVLIVDDDPGITDMLCKLLADYATVVANDLETALKLIADKSVRMDGALVDLHLTRTATDSRGFAVLDALQYMRPEVPRTLLTSAPPAAGMRETIESYSLFELIVKNGADAPHRTRSIVDRMLSDRDDHAKERLRVEMETHVSQAEQSATRTLVASNRALRTGMGNTASVTAALEGLERTASAVEEVRRAFLEAATVDQAKEVVADFARTFRTRADQRG